MSHQAVYPGNKLKALSETKKSYCIMVIEKDGNTAGVCPNPAARACAGVRVTDCLQMMPLQASFPLLAFLHFSRR